MSLIDLSLGLSQGAQGDDVKTLQSYLLEYGYLRTAADSSEIEAFGLDTDSVVDEIHDSGSFDETTEKALRTFQAFNHLPETGELNQETLDKIQQPRCGVADVPSGVSQFKKLGGKWPSHDITYAFKNFTSDLSDAAVISAIEQAFAVWAGETPLKFTRVNKDKKHDIAISFVDKVTNSTKGSNTLAYAYGPPAPGKTAEAHHGDTVFDDAENWTVTVPKKGFDLVSVAVHEFGHALGLDHSKVKDSAMVAYYAGVRRRLHPDDINGIRAIYGGYKISHAMWVQGIAAIVEFPENVESMRPMGSFYQIVGKPNTTNWYHFAIPTPVLVENKRLAIARAILRFSTGGEQAIVRDVHLYDGQTRIATHQSVNIKGDQDFAPFGVIDKPSVRWGIGISMGIRTGTGSKQQRQINLIGAGVDFV